MESISTLLSMYRLVGLACLATVFAIILDLFSGLLAARVRGERRTSYGYARTTLKLLSGVGLVVVCSFVDACLLVGQVWQMSGLVRLESIPLLSLCAAAWTCFVQAVSIRENSADKNDKKACKALNAAIRALPAAKINEIINFVSNLKNNEQQ